MEFDIFSPSAFLQLTGLPGKDMIPPVNSANLAHVASSVHQAKGNLINPPVCSHTVRLNTYSQAAELIFPDNLSNRNSYPEVKSVLKGGFLYFSLPYSSTTSKGKRNIYFPSECFCEARIIRATPSKGIKSSSEKSHISSSSDNDMHRSQ